ncbi:MAG TPA: tetratricopeptide repeat protein, partial [Ktedonobacterales bacterium]|nr:tetratricopeptide repeat protein [Ktedonobacterales bacterium]
ATYDLVEHDLPPDVTMRDLGVYRLKDLQQPERLYQLVLPDPHLPADFPPLKTLDLRPHNLPVQPTPLLGRQEELPAIATLLRWQDVRLVTLTGAGGIGKTRLAVQVAAEVVEDFADGVWFVRLSRLTDPALVLPTIAQALGVKEQGIQPIAETLRAHLAEKRLLLVLDNFEQVASVAPEVARLLEASPGLRVLVTSRQSLHLRGEHVFPVPSLPLPATLAEVDQLDQLDQAKTDLSLEQLTELTEYPAVALFIERARDAEPSFTMTAANALAIVAICARLDGLPLALELAATRVRVLPPAALLARLTSRLKLLTGGAYDLELRQQTMRATIRWSEDLLTPEEQALFRRLAVFVGGGTLEAVEAICGSPAGAAGDEPLSMDILDGLSALVDHSLAQQREEGGEPRFGMLQVMREYALERLEASGEMEALRRAHANYFLALAERAEPELTGPDAGAWLGRLEREHDNLRVALGWSREQREGGAERAEIGLRLIAALGRFWVFRGHLREGRAWAEALLEIELQTGLEAEDTGATAGQAQTAPAVVRARALLSGGGLALWQGDYGAVEIWLERAAVLGQAAGDQRTAARAFNSLGVAAHRQGSLKRAMARFEESLALFRQVGDQWGSALALNNLGDLAVYQGDLERAATVFTEALALFRQVGDRGNTAVCLENLGWVARKRGNLAQAETLQREALALFWELGDLRQCAEALEYLASNAGEAESVEQGKRAARLLGVAETLRENTGAPLPANERADVEEAVAAARAALGEEAWAAAFAAGRALSLEEAVTEALGTDQTMQEALADGDAAG